MLTLLGFVRTLNPENWQLTHRFDLLAFALTDLKFVEESMPSHIGKFRYPSASKQAKTVAVTAEIQRYQSEPFRLIPKTDIQSFILSSIRSALEDREEDSWP